MKWSSLTSLPYLALKVSRHKALWPLLLTTLRVLLAPFILIRALHGLAEWPYVLSLIIAFTSDYFDGVVARRNGVDTARLRRYDSIADLVFYGTAVIAVWFVYPEVVLAYAWGIGLVIGLEIMRVTVDVVKFGREASYHMWSAKGWNISLLIALAALMGFGVSGWLFRLPIIVGVIANLEGLAASLLLPQWTHDVPTFIHAYRIRQRHHHMEVSMPTAGKTRPDIVWLLNEIQAIARTGLHFTDGPYDQERYERLMHLATQTYDELIELPGEELRARFGKETGYITPKVGADAAIFNERGEILLMERADGSGWCLPCGWVEANERPIDAVIREVREETGLEVEVRQLVGVFTRLASARNGPHTMVAVVHLCQIIGGELRLSPEGSALQYWPIDDMENWHPNHDKYARAAHKMWHSEHLLPAISD